ncbi:maleylpyruvate isomerase family mycothiol-dependent enzyme [Streptomyces sp. NPDC088246]|uniref:maleylpyruvate isomerase family mycothiol-dependent enzyme n=1 Tax=Streptomyces sp. NPDC088246 TaxID=3365842 RepID=UPI00380EB863
MAEDGAAIQPLARCACRETRRDVRRRGRRMGTGRRAQRLRKRPECRQRPHLRHDPGQFGRPTPCADWDVRTLLNHLVWENLLWAGLANGHPRSDFTADHLGDDHVEAFHTASRGALTAFCRPGMLKQRYGPAPGIRLVEQLVIEMLVHGWDLARAIGRPPRLRPGSCRVGPSGRTGDLR